MFVKDIDMRIVEVPYVEETDVRGLVVCDAPDLKEDFGDHILVHFMSGIRLAQSSDKVALRNCATHLGQIGEWNIPGDMIVVNEVMMMASATIVEQVFPGGFEKLHDILNARFPIELMFDEDGNEYHDRDLPYDPRMMWNTCNVNEGMITPAVEDILTTEAAVLDQSEESLAELFASWSQEPPTNET